VVAHHYLECGGDGAFVFLLGADLAEQAAGAAH
jgi:hypothetical protein